MGPNQVSFIERRPLFGGSFFGVPLYLMLFVGGATTYHSLQDYCGVILQHMSEMHYGLS